MSGCGSQTRDGHAITPQRLSACPLHRAQHIWVGGWSQSTPPQSGTSLLVQRLSQSRLYQSLCLCRVNPEQIPGDQQMAFKSNLIGEFGFACICYTAWKVTCLTWHDGPRPGLPCQDVLGRRMPGVGTKGVIWGKTPAFPPKPTQTWFLLPPAIQQALAMGRGKGGGSQAPKIDFIPGNTSYTTICSFQKDTD